MTYFNYNAILFAILISLLVQIAVTNDRFFNRESCSLNIDSVKSKQNGKLIQSSPFKLTSSQLVYHQSENNPLRISLSAAIDQGVFIKQFLIQAIRVNDNTVVGKWYLPFESHASTLDCFSNQVNKIDNFILIFWI